MLTSSAVDHFGSKSAIARALKIGKAAVSKWEERVPPLQAARLHQITDGALVFDPSEYEDWYRQKREVA